MFKYCWIVILAVILIIWLIATAVDVIETYEKIGMWFGLFTELNEYSQTFIVVTPVVIFVASLVSWFLSLG